MLVQLSSWTHIMIAHKGLSPCTACYHDPPYRGTTVGTGPSVLGAQASERGYSHGTCRSRARAWTLMTLMCDIQLDQHEGEIMDLRLPPRSTPSRVSKHEFVPPSSDRIPQDPAIQGTYCCGDRSLPVRSSRKPPNEMALQQHAKAPESRTKRPCLGILTTPHG